MGLRGLLHDFGIQLQEFFDAGTDAKARQREMERGRRRVADLGAEVATCKVEVTARKRAIRAAEALLASLINRVAIYQNLRDWSNAWDRALEVDRLRRQIREDRDRWAQSYRRYLELQARLQRAQHELANCGYVA